ncbi:hypothetical protein Q31b_53740 [Novipirellula aureliae]|uniref:THUMP-like domain-containing protein n=1 Tax=Novipirellula aureliae TaxID=2527966 RepID=A0A5C6DF06_9BACT|nr:class I SAM-dependent methyltransferase [Novipirellula aureliae]TWU35278.1 hypothetical protein Q31b_53740 [Novipirellula aureliae]
MKPTQQTIAELIESMPPSPKLVERIRKQFGTQLADECLAAANLQIKARRKFGDGIWWVTEKSLQQATPWQVAKLKATWLGNGTIYDLCCGVGGDSIGFARQTLDRPENAQTNIVAVDVDPVLIRFAQANLDWTFSQMQATATASVVGADVTQMTLPNRVSVHIDPDRRAMDRSKNRSVNGRSIRPEDYKPTLDQTMRLLENTDAALIKMAPAAALPESIVNVSHRSWISLSGSVREQTVLLGNAMERAGQLANRVSAVAVDFEGNAQSFSIGSDQPPSGPSLKTEPASAPGQIMVDPDAAIRAAGLTEAFAQQYQLQTLGGPAGFLTGDGLGASAKDIPMAIVGQVAYSGSCDNRKLRRELRSRNYSVQRVKVRGTDHDPATWSRQLRDCGEIPVTLWIGRTRKRVYAAITEI